jgi:hypothetical protein
MPIVWTCACALTGLLVAFQTTQAIAQNARSFVSGQGLDSNPCTRPAPCRSFGTAIGATNAGGEVVVLDSAGYGPFTVSKAISIVSPGGVEAGITAQTGDAITIAAGTNDAVVLRGLSIQGASGASNGITFVDGLRLEIIDCVIRNFASAGIELYGRSGASSVYVSNTTTADNLTGIDAFARYAMIVGLANVTSINNYFGLSFGSESSITPVEVLISDSYIDNNIDTGVNVGGANVVLRNTTINQTPKGIDIHASSYVWLSQVTEAAVGGFPNNGGVVLNNDGGTKHLYSDGTNRLAGVVGGSPEVWFVQ